MKKSVRKVEKAPKNNEASLKALLSFFVLLVGFSILLIFINYKDAIIVSNSFQLFMTMVFMAMALLIGLLYLSGKKVHTRK